VVRRRNLLLGSAAALGALALGTDSTAASVERSRRLAFSAALPAASGFPMPGGLVCPVPYMSRAAWGADESYRFINGVESWPPDYFPVQALTVHHTGFAASADPADTVRTIYKQQALTSAQGGIQGWGDIGYNMLIDANGVVYEGRHSGSQYPIFGPADRLMTTGGHVLYFNTGNIGVCLLGYLNDVPSTQAAQDSLVTVLAYLAAVGAVNPVGSVNYYNPVPRPDGTHSAVTVLGVSGHRNFAATDCPGNAEYPLLGQIRQLAASSMPSMPKPTQTSTSPTPTQTDGSPSPSDSSSPGSTATTTSAPPTTTKPPTTSSTAHAERGGDEYVAAARKASPSAFPTKAPPPPSPSASPVPSLTDPSTLFSPTLTDAPAAAAAIGTTSGTGWGVPATAAGITVGAVGSAGAWWWRHRRLAMATPAPAPATPTEPSAVEEPTTPTIRPSTVEDPTDPA
jgi:hypothetical protein